MKNIIIFFILFNAFIPSSFAGIKVMSWNLEDMQIFDGAGTERHAKQLEKSMTIAETIKNADPDIVVIVEAPSMVELQSFVRTNHLNYYVGHVRQDKGNINFADCMAMLIKPKFGVQSLDLQTPPLIGSDTKESLRYRDWSYRGLMVADFSDFYLIGVHLKSPIGNTKAKVKKAINRRYKQAESLIEFSKTIDQKPVIIAGDFNDDPGVGEKEQEYGVADTIGLLTQYFSAAEGDTPTHEQGFKIDHIMVKGGEISDKVVIDTSFEISDHRPVWAEVTLEGE